MMSVPDIKHRLAPGGSGRCSFWLAVLGILWLAMALRVFCLPCQSLRGDEGLTYVYGGRSLPEMIEIVTVTSPHPPFYYALMHGWMALAGSDEFALRFPSVVASMLLVAALARLGWTLGGARLGLLVALLAAINPYQVYYAQDARSYPLITALGALSTWWLWRALYSGRRRAWIVYGGLLVLFMYTHYYFFLIVACQALFVAWHAWRTRRLPYAFPVAIGVAGLLYLPWLVLSWQLVSSYKGAGERPDLLAAVVRPLLAFAGGQLLHAPWAWLNGVSMAGLIGLGAAGLWRARRSAGLLAGLYLIVPMLAVYLASRFKSVFDERYLILASPAFLILVAAGLQPMGRRTTGRWLQPLLSGALAAGLLSSGMLALGNYYFDPEFAKSPPWSEVLAYIARKARPGDALVYTAPLPPILYYNAERLPAYLIPSEQRSAPEQTVEELQRVLGQHPRIWLIPTDLQRRPAAVLVEPWLDRHSARLDQVFFRQIHIGLYQSPDAFLASMTRQPVEFGDGIRLEGFRLADGTASPYLIRPGGQLPLTLVWRARQTPALAYTVFTHLIGPDGQLWGQWDNPPVRGSYPTREWLPGEMVFDPYQLPVKDGAYDAQSGARLPVLDRQGQPIADHVTLDAHIELRDDK
jgi:mannosyltransferase